MGANAQFCVSFFCIAMALCVLFVSFAAAFRAYRCGGCRCCAIPKSNKTQQNNPVSKNSKKNSFYSLPPLLQSTVYQKHGAHNRGNENPRKQ
jgi:hypothetical protein